MGRIVITEFVSLDGVIEAPGGGEGFKYDGWSFEIDRGDEGNAFKPVNLESLRLLTNMQEDDRNLFTIVLAGQPKLAKMLEAPARANLFQRIGVYCNIERMEFYMPYYVGLVEEYKKQGIWRR